MNIRELVDLAAATYGSKAALAREMQKQPPRISEWYRGEQKPDAHEIAFMAKAAGLPVLETVAEIEAQLDERYAQIWRDALGKLKAAGIAAGVSLILQGALPSEKAYADQAVNAVSPTKQEYTLWQVS
jgi:hypothetical protein